MPAPLFLALAPVICSMVTASAAVTGGSIAIGAKVADSASKRRQSRQEKAVKAYVDRFSVISYTLENEQSSIFVPLLLILNRDHKEIRQFYNMLNLLPRASPEVIAQCPCGVGDAIHPIYKDRPLQKRPLIVKSQTVASLFGAKSAALAYPAENTPLWLTEQLYITITATQINFHVLDSDLGQQDWNKLKALIDFLAARTLTKEQRGERIRRYIFGTHQGDRPNAGLPEPYSPGELIPVISQNAKSSSRPAEGASTTAVTDSSSEEGWVIWGIRKMLAFCNWVIGAASPKNRKVA